MTTLNLQVGAGTDDAWEYQDDTGFDSSGANIRMTALLTPSVRRDGGFRFTSVTIGQADTINTCTAQVDGVSTSVDDMDVTIHLEDVDNSVDFSSDPDVVNRARTTASTAWQADSLGTGWVTSPDFTSAMQELVDRGSWASGNAATMLFRAAFNVTAKTYYATSYDGSSSLAPKLDITYTAGGAATRRYTLTTLGVG